MRKIIVVAFREYQAAVKTKAFILSLVMMPIMMGGSIVVQMFMKDRTDTESKRIAIVDQTGKIADSLVAAATEWNERGVYKTDGEARKQVKPKFLLEVAEPSGGNLDDVNLRLSDRVNKNELFAYVVIHREALNPAGGAPKSPSDGNEQPSAGGSTAQPAPPAVAYHSNSPTYDVVLDWLEQPMNDRIRELRLAEANLKPEQVLPLTARTSIANLGLVTRDAATGAIKPAEESNRAANVLMPLGIMMLMFMIIMVGATPLMQTVLEEKTNRIAEVLIGSISPFHLMLGKLIGMVGVTLTIVTIYLVGAFWALDQSGYGKYFPTHIVWWFAAYQVLAILMFGSVFAAIGAAVSDAREAQSMMTPVMLVVVSPMFIWLNVVKEPLSSFSTIASLFPPATPMLMTMRQAVPPGVPAWQPALGIVLVLLTTILCVFAAGRIFRVGILMQGQGAKVGEMLRWVLRG